VQRVDVTHEYALPPERVYACLEDHANFQPLFGAQVRRVRDGESSPNGTGSVRALRIGPLPWFEETIVEAVEPSLIRYQITRGTPLRDHEGVITLTPTETGCRVHYVIEFGTAVPGLGKIAQVGLTRAVVRGLRRVERLA
jgi:uncharacterized protein YndB with AHSA1/START domain